MTYADKLDYVFQALADTSTPLAEFGRLTGISRYTLAKWRDGKPTMDKVRVDVAYATAQRLYL